MLDYLVMDAAYLTMYTVICSHNFPDLLIQWVPHRAMAKRSTQKTHGLTSMQTRKIDPVQGDLNQEKAFGNHPHFKFTRGSRQWTLTQSTHSSEVQVPIRRGPVPRVSETSEQLQVASDVWGDGGKVMH